MKKRIGPLLAVIAALLVAGLSLGAKVFLSLALLLALVLVVGYASVRGTVKTLNIQTRLGGRTVVRGEDVNLELRVSHRGVIPVAPMVVELLATPEMPEAVIRVSGTRGKTQTASLRLHASHVGVSQPGIRRCVVEDVFGLFTYTWVPGNVRSDLLVLPQVFPVEKLRFAPGDPGMGTMARASEDLTSPSDTRAYAPGDPMKKIHWKLSLRKRELLVRKFEEPILPDALVLLDLSRPDCPAGSEDESDLRDALTETAASVMACMEHSDHAVRLPLWGEHPIELEKGMGLPLILENLARADFSQVDGFERMLLLELPRMSRVGAVVVITSRLAGGVVEVITHMRRMGPMVRLYYVTFTPNDPDSLVFITRLQNAGVEVNYVTPMKA